MWLSELCTRTTDGLCVGQSPLLNRCMVCVCVCVNEFLVHAAFVCVGSMRDSVITGVRVLFVHKYLQINREDLLLKWCAVCIAVFQIGTDPTTRHCIMPKRFFFTVNGVR